MDELTPQEKGVIFRYLDPEYQEAYANGELTDEDLRQWGVDTGLLRADFSGVKASLDSTAEGPPEAPGPVDGVLDRVRNTGGIALDALTGGGTRSAGAALFANAELGDNDPGALNTLPFVGGTITAIDALQQLLDPAGEQQKRLGKALFEQGTEEVKAAGERAEQGNAFGDTFTRGIADVAGSPSGLASIIGGPAAAIPAADVFNQEYTAGRLAGLDKDEAAARGTVMGSVEGAISVIPAGKFLGKIPGLDSIIGREAGERLANDVTKTFFRVAKTSAGEATEEGLTTLAQLGADKALSIAAPSQDLRDYAESNIPKDIAGVWDETWRSVVAGSIGGAGLGTPMETMRTVAERGAMASELTSAVERSVLARQQDRRRTNAIEPTPVAVTPVGNRDEEIEKAYQQRDAQRVEEIRQENARERVANLTASVDTARSRIEELQEAIEGGDTSQATLSTFAAANRDLRRAETLLNNEVERQNTVPATPAPVVEEAPAVEAAPAPVAKPVDPKVLERREKVRQSVLKLTEGDNKKVLANAKSRRAAARRSFIRQQNTELATLPVEERTERLTDATVEWDDANPIENFMPAPATPAPKTTTPAPVVQQTEEVAEEVEAPERPVVEELDSMLKGLASTRTGRRADQTTKTVVREMVNKLGRGDTKKLAKLITDGNIELVDDAADISEDAEQVNAAGYYDGNKMYIVANKLNPQNVVGDMLELAAHEVKHAADLSGNPTLRKTLGGFVGERANRSINNKIQELAAANNPVAMAAVRRANDAEEANPGSFALELPAYFINEARARRDRSGAIGSVLGDAVSAVRTAAKKVMPGDYEVNLNDVAYLSDKLIKEAAISGDRLTSDQGGGLSMIVGPQHPRFAELPKYTGKDGNLRAVVSDVGSTVNLDPLTQKAISKQSGPVPLERLMQHDELYDAYPRLRDVKVVVNDSLDVDSAQFLERDNIIELSPSFFNNLIVLGDRAKSHLRSALLHEVQHAVQGYEGHARGGNVDQFYSNQDRKVLGKFDKAASELRDIIVPMVDKPMSLNKLNDDTKRDLRHYGLQWAGDEVTSNVVYDVMEILSTDTSGFSRKRQADIQELYDTVRTLLPQVDNIREAAQEKYKNLYGEIEAYWTEAVKNVRQEDLPANPDDPNAQIGFRRLRVQTTPSVGLNFPGSGITNVRREGLASTPEEGRVIPPRENERNPRTEATKRAIGRTLLPGGGYPDEMQEAFNHARGSQARKALNSDHLTREFANAIDVQRRINDKMAGMTEQEAREVILKRMDEIDKLPTREARSDALNDLDSDYPGVGSAVRDIRDLKLELTRDIFRLRMEDKDRPLTDKERNVFRKMAENAETYTTRAYLATYNREIGSSYGKRLMKAARENPNSREAQIVGDAMDYIVNEELMIPDAGTLMNMPVDKVRRIYAHWLLGNPDKHKGFEGKKEMVEQLNAHRETANASNLEQKALGIVEDMLGLSGRSSSVRTRLTGAAKQNRTILEGREDIPVVLRTLMGEITDPVVRESLSLVRMANLVTKTKLLNELFERGEGKWWSHVSTPQHGKQLNGESFGPLNGKWVDVMAEDAMTGIIINDQSADEILSDIVRNPESIPHWAGVLPMRGMRKIMRAQKLVQIVVNGANMGLNLVGSPLMMTMNGINPKYAGKAMRNTALALSFDVTKSHADTARIERAGELIEAGAIDSASVGEFQGDLYKGLIEEMRKLTDGGKTPTYVEVLRTARKWFGGTRDGFRQMYAFMDVWVKGASYYSNKDYLTEYYKLEGIDKTDEEIRREAGFIASGTNISYERAIPLAKMLEQNTPFAMFMTYFTETFRATGMNYIQAYRDAQRAKNSSNPQARALAMREAIARSVGTTAVLASVIGGTLAVLGNEDDEEKKQRLLDPEYLRETVMVPMGTIPPTTKGGTDGKVQWFNVNRLDPIGPFNEFVVKVTNAELEDKPDVIMDSILDMFVPSKSVKQVAQIFNDAIATTGLMDDMRRNKKTLTEKNFPELYRALTSFRADMDIPENLIAAVEGLTIPSMIAAQVDGDERNAFGYKPYVRDPEKSLGFRIGDYEMATKDLRKEFKEFLYTPGRTTDEIAGRMNAVLADEREAFLTLRESTDGFLASPLDQLDTSKGNFTKSHARQIFKAERQTKMFPHLIKGEFVSAAIKEKDLKEWYDVRRKTEGVNKAQAREEYQILRRLYLDSVRGEEN